MSREFGFGIEEEYFITNPRTRTTLSHMPQRMLDRCREQLGVAQVSREMLQSQIEVVSGICHSAAEGREELIRLRATVCRVANEYELGLIAAGTHPMAEWVDQRQTDKPRYDVVMDDLRMLGQRNLVCGQHVHVSLPDPARRIDVMNRIVPFLPVLLALSTSSPFWKKHRTGLMGYRLAAYDELPRTGLPPMFRDPADYDRYVETLTVADVIPDASYLWWAIRPSLKFPTLELRVADCCTHVDDALCIAALYRCLIRLLFRRPALNANWSGITRFIADENKWRAQRYGIEGGLVDEASRRLAPFSEVLESILALVGEDAQALGCEAEIGHAREIVKRGTSAHGQLAVYRSARDAGLNRLEALKKVVDWLLEKTPPR
jgi:carboxylate-amine ligase